MKEKRWEMTMLREGRDSGRQPAATAPLCSGLRAHAVPLYSLMRKAFLHGGNDEGNLALIVATDC